MQKPLIHSTKDGLIATLKNIVDFDAYSLPTRTQVHTPRGR